MQQISLPRSHAIYGVSHLAALMRLLPERDPHAALHEALDAILDRLDDAELAAPMVARFELQLLSELGFGLDLAQCASTGATGDLIYVSPKSGRAVSRAAGEPWADKLLRLPAFLREPSAASGRRRSYRRLRRHRLFPGAVCTGAARARALGRTRALHRRAHPRITERGVIKHYALFLADRSVSYRA